MSIIYDRKTFKVHRDAQEIPVKAKVDVLVCGGGPAGIGAALGAAKGEASVMIIEKNNCLGGLATSGLVTTFAGGSIFSGSEEGNPKVKRRQVIKGVVWEFIERLINEGGAISPEEFHEKGYNDAATFDIEVYKRAADDIMEEWGINLLYYTLITGAIMEGDTIKGVIVENKAGCQAILADIVIDATGDGDVAYMAGAPYKIGRNEDGKTQPLTTMFRIGGMPEVGKEQIEKFSKFPKGKVQPYFLFWEAPEFTYGHVCVFGTPRKGEYRCEMTRSVDKNGLDPDDLTRAEIECRRQVPRIVEYFRREYPGAENVYLIDTASMIGVQDSRRITGEYEVTMDDLLNCKEFEDAISLGCYPVDLHNPMGRGFDMRHIKQLGQAYGVPYRSIVPLKVEHLLVAGRCISSDIYAESALRIASNCMAIGEAAGTAAALCIVQKTIPRKLNVKQLREKLLAQGACLEQFVYEDVQPKNKKHISVE